jgi:hypothetical protein
MSPLPSVPPHIDAPSQTGGRAVAARGLAAGIVAAAALLGILLGYGRRQGTLWRPLNAAAHTVLGGHADGVWGYQTDVTPTGVAVVFVLSVVAGFVAARLAFSHRVSHLVAASAGVAFTGYLLHLHVVARMPGGLAELLSVGQLRALYLALGIALFAGMRFAFYGLERTPVS